MRQIFFMFGILLLFVSCDKKDSDSPSSPAPITPTELTPAANDPAPDAPIPSAPAPDPVPDVPPLPAPLPQDPSPVQSLAGLKIQTQGNFIVGQMILLKAIGQYIQPSEEKPVIAQWSLLLNEAAATIDAAGRLRATQVGKIRVQAQFADKTAEADLQIDIPPTTVQQEQFWIYQQDAGQLKFNTPWDADAGNEIRLTREGVPPFGLSCLTQAKEKVAALQNKIGPLLIAGGTSQLIYLVNVVPWENKRDDLRRLDRDAYFWHWNRLESRPLLSFSQFREGSWVWEVIATPTTCLQPDEKELERYINYALKRLRGGSYAP